MTSHASENQLGLDKSRIEALTDGIFAFGMTLLVLDLKIPDAPGLDLRRALLHLWPKFLSYATSFLVLGLYWIAHRGYAHFLKRTDRYYLWFNLLFLMVVVLVPFSTDLLGDHPHSRLAIVVYGLNIDAIGLTLYLQWRYATDKHRLVSRELERDPIRRGRLRMQAGFFSYTAAMLLCFVSPIISLVLYALIPLGFILPSRIDEHWDHPHR